MFVGNLLASYLGVWGLYFLFARQSREERAVAFVMVTASLALVIAVAESFAVIGIIDYRTVFHTPILSPARNPRYRHDPELLFVRRPHERITGRFARADLLFMYSVPNPAMQDHPLTYDANGFRNSEDLTRADLAVIGDSFVEATAVPDSALLTGVLARRFGWTVANLGQIQYGPQQELAVLRRFALPLRPKAIVWIFFEGNDLYDATLYEEVRADTAGFFASRNSLVERSLTKNLLSLVHRLAGGPRPSAFPRSGLMPLAGGGEQRVYFLYAGHALSGDEERGLALTASALRDGYQSAERGGARLILAFAPNKYRAYASTVRVDAGGEARSWIVNDLPDRLREIVRSISDTLAFVDLTPALTEAARAGQSPYFWDDSHWSPLGHQVVARVLGDTLRAKLGLGEPKPR